MDSPSFDPPIRAVRREGRTAIVDVAGDVDLGTSQRFQQGLLAVLADGPQRIVVDLSAVPHMDSSGIASLVKLLSRARKAGVSLCLAGVAGRVRSLLEITRLDTVFEIAPLPREAVA